MQLNELKGVGPKTLDLLHKLNIYSINDLIHHYPFRYDVLVRTNTTNLNDKDKVITDGIVESKPLVMNFEKKIKIITFRLNDGTNIYSIIIYNQIYLLKYLEIGKPITIIGKYDKKKNSIIVNSVRFEKLPNTPKIETVYRTVNGLPRKTLSTIIDNALKEYKEEISYIPDYLEEKYTFINKKEAVKEIHSPSNNQKLKQAKLRLIYEELFIYMLKITNIKNKNAKNIGIARKINIEKINNFINSLPFELTPDQIKVYKEILEDMTSGKQMNRLLQGDVGSGKTIIAFISAYVNYLSGFQTALMAPTEILANQHYINAMNIFKNTNMSIRLMTSSTKPKEKKEIYEDLLNGKINFIIGTQSLIQDKVIFNNLGLIITDEQHRFGVNQRTKAKEKGAFPDVLSMSATPIPRTYALTIYGDMDVSSIKTKPVGRKEVITKVFEYDNLLSTLKLVKQELDNKHQIYVVVPLIDDEDESEKENITKVEDSMNKAFSKIAKIKSLHGKMDTEEKDKIMNDFKQGKTDILISTTVIEVGVDVKNATVMVVFDANYFGLSTLHQLRGRVGRGDLQSYCILITKTPCERLEILEKTNDGFEISEYDFEHRGEGDLFGVKQSGAKEFKLANVIKDYKIMLQAKEDAVYFLKSVNQNNYKHISNLLNKNINQD